MKYIHILFLLLFYIGTAQNNSVPIQDPNFEQALIDLNIDDSINGEVQLDSVNNLTYLNVDSKNISDLSGIENFQALDTLVVSNNQLSSIDSSNLNSLNYLDASYNSLNTFSLNTNIEEIFFQYNQLEFVDLSSFSNLNTIHLNDNNLKQLNINNGNNVIGNFDVDFKNNPLLKCIKVDDVAYMYALQVSAIDSDNTIYSKSDCVSYCDTPSTAPSEYLVGTYVIRDVTLPAVNYNGQLYDYTFLGESQLQQISPGSSSGERTLPAKVFPLLLASGPPNYANDTIKLNLACDRFNLELTPDLELGFDYDGDHNYFQQLQIVTPNDNYVTSLNHSANQKDYIINYKQSPYEVVGDSLVTDIGSFEILKINDSYDVNDINFEQKLIDLGHDDVLDGKIWADNIYDVKHLYLENENISDLTGIEGFRILETLNVSNNNITTLNLDKNYHLQELKANNNNLTALNLESHQDLEKLQAENNNLISVNIRNNHNDNFQPNTVNFQNFNLLNNPNLNCIDVSDENYMNTHFSNYIDGNANFSEIPCETMDIASFDNQFTIYPNPANLIITIKMRDQLNVE